MSMWRATLKGIAAHKVRLLLTTLAVVLGVGFVAGTYMLTDTMNAAFDDLFHQINKGIAVDVSGVQQFKGSGFGGETAGAAERVPSGLLDTVQNVDGVRAAEGSISGYAQLVDRNGKAITTGGAPTLGTNWLTDPGLNSVTIREGRAPSRAGEVAIDAGTAAKYGLHVRDEVEVLLQGPSMRARIVGIVGFGQTDNLGGATSPSSTRGRRRAPSGPATRSTASRSPPTRASRRPSSGTGSSRSCRGTCRQGPARRPRRRTPTTSRRPWGSSRSRSWSSPTSPCLSEDSSSTTRSRSSSRSERGSSPCSVPWAPAESRSGAP